MQNKIGKETILLILAAFTLFVLIQLQQTNNCLKGSKLSDCFASSDDDDFGSRLHRKLPFTNFNSSLGKQETEFWNSIIPSFECPSKLIARVGKSGDGGKWTCGLQTLVKQFCPNPEQESREPCLLYSFGVNGDSSFEAEVLATTHCQLYAYDPSVSSIANPLRTSNPRVHFEKLGLDGVGAGDKRKLSTLMKNNGHENRIIDILKIDIEGDEFSTLENVFEEFPGQLPFAQLLIEFHVDKEEWENGKGDDRVVGIFNRLEERGLRMFKTEYNTLAPPGKCSEFSFVNLHKLDLLLEKEDLTNIL